MISAWTKRRNIILADEMGLGKTIQAMSFINHLITAEKIQGPFMIIAPLSTLQHWKRVFEEWSYINTILYYDSNGKKGRACCREYEWYRNDITQKGTLTQHYKIGKF
jgi:chromodomain-helicase-DNA-binding protein 7